LQQGITKEQTRLNEREYSHRRSEGKRNAGGKTGKLEEKEQPTDPSFNMDELRELAELVNEHGFTDFEFENENIRVRLSKMTAPAVIQTLPSTVVPVANALTCDCWPQTAEQADGPPKPKNTCIRSHRRSSERSIGRPSRQRVFVREGDQVTPETVVCIVEAMKLMNEIQAETTGDREDIC
jgi:biotin carboxyl carrier protein